MSYTYEMLQKEAEEEGVNLSASSDFAAKVEEVFLPLTNVHRSFDAEGILVFQWRSQDSLRRFTLYIEASKIFYVKSWGPNMVTDMEDGEMTLEDTVFIEKVISWVEQ